MNVFFLTATLVLTLFLFFGGGGLFTKISGFRDEINNYRPIKRYL